MSKEAKKLVKQMSIDEKLKLLSGKDFWNTQEIETYDLPSIMMTDGPHGVRKQDGSSDHVGLNDSVKATCFPTASLLASTWDKDLLYQVGSALGIEARSEGVSVLLGPGVNIKRHPLCGRNFEYFSEDPILSGMLAKSYIQGVQSQGVGASVKHYVANNQETLRMAIDTIIDQRTLHELYLKGFEVAIKEGKPWTVMCAYNKVNGEYMSEHKVLLDGILRAQWKFDGVVVTDWGACNDRVKGLKNGQDLEMPSSRGSHDKQIIKSLTSHQLLEEVVDSRVEKIVDLIQKARTAVHQNKKTLHREKHHAFARRVASEGMILLQNKRDILPLDKSLTIALIGDFAKHPRYQGSGSSLINPTHLSTAYDALHNQLQDRLYYAAGYNRQSDQINKELLEEAITVAKRADVVVIMAGLTDDYESEGFDRTHLHLPHSHNALIQQISMIHQKVIVVLANGAPVLMPWRNHVQGIVEMYLSGQAGGLAVADILFGDVNPSGKLAETFPNNLAEIPANQNFAGEHRQVVYKEGLYVGYRAYDSIDLKPAFPFGFGLSYTTFDIRDVIISFQSKHIEVSCTIYNTGTIVGKEVVQVYVGKKDSAIYRPNKELKEFTKVEVKGLSHQTILLRIPKAQLAVYYNGKFVVENGCYEVYVGTSSVDIVSTQQIVVRTKHVLKQEEPSIYWNVDCNFHPTNSDFEQLLGYPIPLQEPVKPYHMNTVIKEIKQTFVGRQLMKQIYHNMASVMGEDMDDNGHHMIDRMVDDLPLRSLVLLSNGLVQKRRVQGLVDILNKKWIRGLYRVIRG